MWKLTKKGKEVYRKFVAGMKRGGIHREYSDQDMIKYWLKQGMVLSQGAVLYHTERGEIVARKVT